MTRRRLGWWTLAILVLLGAAVPASYLLRPHVQRWRALDALGSPDVQQRERALNYVIRLAPRDDRVRRGAAAKLDSLNDEHFVQLVAALDTAALWRRGAVGDSAWLRWIAHLGAADDAEAKIAAAQQLADLHDLAADPRVTGVLAALAGAGDADVRYNALVAAGELGDEPVIAALAHDDEPVIARHAWMMLGLIDPSSGVTANWRDVPPDVAAAMLWAVIRTNPRAPLPALEALGDPAKRDAAAYALAFSDTPEAAAALLAILQTPSAMLSASNQTLIWRAILAAPQPNIAPKQRVVPDYTPLEEAFSVWLMDEGPNAWAEPIALAATYRAGIEGAMRHSDDRFYFEKAMLATVEGQAALGEPWMHWPLRDNRKSPLLRVQTIAVSASPDIAHLRDAFASDDAALRDLACVTAVATFPADVLEPEIAKLIGDYDDDAKMSGAILAGMTGLQLDLLTRREAIEDVFRVRVTQRLGLWMADRMAMKPGDLLLRDDLPRPTILLAMLHKGEYSALDHLLNPRGEVGDDVLDLLVSRRWWCVLERYLPTLPGATLWLWADPALQRFQFDVLRCWWLLHRHAMETGQRGDTEQQRHGEGRHGHG